MIIISILTLILGSFLLGHCLTKNEPSPIMLTINTVTVVLSVVNILGAA